MPTIILVLKTLVFKQFGDVTTNSLALNGASVGALVHALLDLVVTPVPFSGHTCTI